ncbi:sodium:proton antiporter [Arthrobacter sp. zg-Y820]|uniref:cation:proton antiporter n=1 Tax=unclassified Arthrobacter TaxID=235627 RepID=UPI002541B41B|nr:MULTISPECIES: sodium:proton antiporter [unclassified Arthrobacter]MCC9197396.1 sodium:proton antiporter [Arthrobacter sp. zg-Y820]MDK1280262.1 sodium:proton antiporter [Arthrobacter sp. zg.Y820]MDK1360601.1 sodium:proton antiporter [Arthrobacter sp. zg-Y1219]WIB09549.1 sodium:proton antiporter [Arthrobacter sp. zg-Y820]
MELALFAVIGVAVIVTVAAFSKRLGIAAPLILVVVGLGLSYLPGLPTFTVPHDVILMGVLPPLLYAAAVNVPVVDFRRNFGAISSLSVFLVLFSAAATGLLLYLLLPDLDLAAAIALGAVVSPPDAVAATSIGKKLGLPPRLVTVLEGEGLVNDATALVLLRSALAVSAGSLSSIWAGVADFGFAVAAAVVVGLLVGVATVWIRSKLNDPTLDTAISFVVPFLAFIPAEEMHASGVLAVVVAGLYTGHRSASAFSAQARINDSVNWHTVQFLLENGVFLLMGLELRYLVENINPDLLTVGESVGIGLAVTALLILLRFAWMGPLILLLRAKVGYQERRTHRFRAALDRLKEQEPGNERSRRRADRAEDLYRRRRADITQLRSEGLDWRGGMVIGWSGMRGVVTLAAAQSLPETTPYREQLVLIAFTVAVVTLLLQGGTLPWMIRILGVRGANAAADQRSLATLLDQISDAGLKVLEDPQACLQQDVDVDPDVVERVRQSTFLRSELAWERVKALGVGTSPTPQLQYRELRRAVVDAEREALLLARREGYFPSRTLADAQRLLDLEESRLKPRLGER